MKSYKPTSASRRGATVINYSDFLTSTKPSKRLRKGVKRRMGRNNRGRITVRHKGGGSKRLYRQIDFKYYDKKDIPAKIETIEYDPNRSGFIALVCYSDGERRYIVAPASLNVGDEIITSEKAPIKTGNRLPLSKIPVGTFVYNIELKEKSGAKIARSAGNYAEVVAHDGNYTHLKMPSSEIRKAQSSSWASIGEVSNPEYKLVVLGKAGRSRWLGIRPTVRGTAMNPVDHPHGGGEGRSGRGTRRAKTMWGKPSGKGQKTRHPNKYSNKLIVQRRRIKRKK